LAGQAADGVILTGILRVSEPKGGFLRANAPTAQRWYSRDVTAIAQAHGLGPVAPYFIDADATPNPGGYPLGGLTVISFPNSHLTYIITWFTLAAMCMAALFAGPLIAADDD
jgi:surfeit locus 1 family protein